MCTLIDEFSCDPNTKGFDDIIPLHYAAQKGHVDIVRKLVLHYRCDVMARNKYGSTPLHYAVLGGSLSTVRTLIDEFKCDPNTKAFKGKIPLHCAAQMGHVDIVWKLVFDYGGDISMLDNFGNTIWHYITQTACGSSVKQISEKVLRTYKKMMSYSSAILGHVLVVGSPGAGKSTLVEALKSDTLFRMQVRNVPHHTAGIIPHRFEGKKYRRIIFYDFAGDPQFNFSQAAVLELTAFTECSVVLVVVDMSKPVNAEGIMYWLQLIFHVTKKFPQVIIVGSHADLAPRLRIDPERELSQICKDLSSVLTAEYPGSNFSAITHVSLDCRYTKSNDLQKLHISLQGCFKNEDTRRISSAAVILLQILSEVVDKSFACTVSEVQKYMTKIEIGLSTDALLCWTKELESHGYVLVLRNKINLSDSWIITDVMQFVHKVHEQLFSQKAKDQRGAYSNFGLIPVSQLSVLFPHLPPSVLVSCFELLQYCFEINDPNVLVENITQSAQVPGERYLFFPSLFEGVRSEVKWIISGDGVCTLGWYITCEGKCSFLPPRFVYVLMLQLATQYSHLRGNGESKDHSSLRGIRHRCNVWKNGICWVTESGVEGFVEVVKESRGVMVVMRSKHKMECGETLRSVVRKVSDILKEFCHALVTTEYLLDPKELQSLSSLPEIDSLELYLISDVKRVLSENKGRNVINERKTMEASDIDFLRTYPLWGKSQAM